jgi:hypothetical protein
LPTPLAASATFGVVTPLGPGAARRLILGGATFPVAPPGTGGSLLAACDPFLAATLPFFQHVLSTRLSTAYAAAMAGQALAAENKACVETCPMDPGPFLNKGLCRLPLLAVFPVSGKEGERTMHKAKIDALYRAVYVLPTLNYEQAKRVTPLLSGIVRLLTALVQAGGVADYQSGAQVWSGVASVVRIVEHQIGASALGEDTMLPHYALTADLQVELLGAYDSASANPFWGANVQIDLASPDGSNLPGFIAAKVNVG